MGTPTQGFDTPAPRHSPWLRLPPPLLFGTAFIAGWLLGKVSPPRYLLPEPLWHAGRLVGFGLLAVALSFIAPAVWLFLRHRTTLIPHSRDARVLVAGGPFRITRNPMYVGFTTAYVGAALVANVAWPLVLVALPLWVVNAKVIPYEEGNLLRNFGDSYRAYQKRVRRWL